MPNHLNQPVTQNQTPGLFWWILSASVALAMLPTIWTSLDLDAAALFLGPAAPIAAAKWWWVEWINLYIPAAFRTVVILALLGWLLVGLGARGKNWRLTLAFVVLGGALGPGLLVNSGFKDNWQRARPYQVQPFGGTQQFTRAAVMTDQCNNNCSFVSGHVACGFFLASLMLVHRRRRCLWGAIGVASGLVIGFARMADGAHWLSDVLWACPITLLCSWCLWKILLRIYPPTQSPAG
jgi:lipid A 4'-phosphatase